MRRRLATLAALSVIAIVFSAAPVLARPAVSGPLRTISFPATWLGSMCGYTFTSGNISEVFNIDGAIADPDTGEWLYIPAAHVRLSNVWAEDNAGTSYRVLGVEIYSDLNGHLTAKLMFVGQGGGIADSINIIARTYPSGELHFGFDLGTCSFA